MLTATEQTISLKAKLFQGFADPTRLSIVEALQEGSLTVNEIVQQTQLGQSNVSNHLRCLSDCGLVVSEREGRNVRYELSDPRVAQLIGLAEELLADVARGVYVCTRYSDKDVPRK